MEFEELEIHNGRKTVEFHTNASHLSDCMTGHIMKNFPLDGDVDVLGLHDDDGDGDVVTW